MAGVRVDGLADMLGALLCFALSKLVFLMDE